MNEQSIVPNPGDIVTAKVRPFLLRQLYLYFRLIILFHSSGHGSKSKILQMPYQMHRRRRIDTPVPRYSS